MKWVKVMVSMELPDDVPNEPMFDPALYVCEVQAEPSAQVYSIFKHCQETGSVTVTPIPESVVP